jgi:hypothetical protein
VGAGPKVMNIESAGKPLDKSSDRRYTSDK